MGAKAMCRVGAEYQGNVSSSHSGKLSSAKKSSGYKARSTNLGTEVDMERTQVGRRDVQTVVGCTDRGVIFQGPNSLSGAQYLSCSSNTMPLTSQHKC